MQQFLSGLGLRHVPISQKMISLRKNPEEDVYVLGRDKNSDLVGLAEVTVEYKLTHGLSKVLVSLTQVYHVESIHVLPSLNADISGSFRVE